MFSVKNPSDLEYAVDFALLSGDPGKLKVLL